MISVFFQMNSAFPTSLNVSGAQDLARRFQSMSVADFSPGEDTEDCKINVVFLHGRRSLEPIKFKSPSGFEIGNAKIKIQVFL